MARSRLVTCLLGLFVASCGGANEVESPAITASASIPAAPAPTPPKPPVPMPPARPPAPIVKTALVHVNVVDVTNGKTLPDRTIVLEGDRIASVGDATPPAGVRTIDLKGKYVIPGLWDMHVHFTDSTYGKLFVANGVTGVRVMWGNPRIGPGTERLHFQIRDAFDKKLVVGPRMVIASQIFDGPKPFWPNSVALSTPEEAKAAVDEAKASGVDFIKVYSHLPRPVFAAIAEESKKQGLPFVGHVPVSMSVAEASDAGQKSIEHLTGMAIACSKHENELRLAQRDFAKTQHTNEEWTKLGSDQLKDALASYDDARAKTLFAKLATNGTWQTPTFTVLESMSHLDDPKLANDPRLAYVPDYVRKHWDPKDDFRTKSWKAEDYALLRRRLEREKAIIRDMNKAHVPILAGTDEVNPYCFPGFSLHDELGLLVKAGLTPAEALRSATSGPATFLGREGVAGTVSEGKVADLVVLDANPLENIANTRKIHAVVSRGSIHDRAALDRMLADAKESAAHPKMPAAAATAGD